MKGKVGFQKGEIIPHREGCKCARHGGVPWNKGMKGYLNAGSFKKGHKDLSIKFEEHKNWKGDKVGYTALHKWVRRILGIPVFCNICKTSKAKRFDWANISGQYQRSKEDWQSLCRSCHIKYDRARKYLSVKEIFVLQGRIADNN